MSWTTLFSDSYVRGKLGKATMPGDLRCELCELAIEEHEHITKAPRWLRVSRAESEYRNGFVDFGPVSKALGSYLNSTLVGPDKFLKYPLHTIYVCGLDHFNKCTDVERLAKTEYIKCAVIYRKGSEERHVRLFGDSSNIIYVGLEDERQTLVDISSTAIRQRLATSADDLDEFTYKSVARRLKSKALVNLTTWLTKHSFVGYFIQILGSTFDCERLLKISSFLLFAAFVSVKIDRNIFIVHWQKPGSILFNRTRKTVKYLSLAPALLWKWVKRLRWGIKSRI